MKVTRLMFEGPMSFPRLAVVGELYSKDGQAANYGWTMTGTAWGVRVEKGDTHSLVPWHKVKRAEYDPASVK
jgi:hypothetical protein